MLLTKDTRDEIRNGDILRFADGSGQVKIKNIIRSRYGVNITVEHNGRTVYGERLSDYYGAEIIKGSKPIILNSKTRDIIKVGDVLKSYHDYYTIEQITESGTGKLITLFDVYGRRIYEDRLSNWYGTEIIKGE